MSHQHPAGKAFVKKWKGMVDKARDRIRKSQESAAKHYNKSRTDVAYTVGASTGVIVLKILNGTDSSGYPLEIETFFLRAVQHR